MKLGVVVGALWGARRATGLDRQKLLKIELEGGGVVVAVDGLAAGPGDRVLVAHGSRVRDLTLGEQVAAKDVVVAIVDDLWVSEQSERGRPEALPMSTPRGSESA